jgi:IMP cyclohydrolase
LNRYTIEQTLGSNAYPGRGILLGKSEDNLSAVMAYFIMGRSENSRNRVFLEDGTGIRTEVFEPSKMSDPSLIIYSPVSVLGDYTVVTNGDQTDTVCDALSHGGTFEDALRARTFEPDRPNFTPRISGLVETGEKFRYRLSILKSGDAEGKSVQRFFYEYDRPAAGEGRLIHTYLGNGDPLPSFVGEPTRVAVEGSIDEFANRIWTNLNEDNKISLFVRFINLKTKLTETRIFNKNLCRNA